MSNPEKPANFSEAMIIARDVAPVATDDRNVFEVYLDIAKIVVPRRLNETLNRVPVSAARKKALLAAEAYDLAQTSHIEDVGGETLGHSRLLDMLDEIGVLGFDCKENCDERIPLYNATGVHWKARVEAEGITLETITGGAWSLMSINEAFEEVLAPEVPDGLKGSLFNGAIVCRKSPECQEDCPLPKPDSKRYTDVIESVVALSFEKLNAVSHTQGTE